MPVMVLLAAAALSIAPPPAEPRPAAAVVQSTVTIRVISGVTLKLNGEPNPGMPAARDSTIKAPDGAAVSAKLIEFQ
jgi:hypothetical protein